MVVVSRACGSTTRWKHHKFDDRSKFLATSRARRGVISALARLLGLGIAGAQDAHGESTQKRRRRKRTDRRQSELRGFQLTVRNSLLNPQAVSIELGRGTHVTPYGQCCLGQAAYTLELGETRVFTPKNVDAYLWVENRYVIYFTTTAFGLPFLAWAIDGSSGRLSQSCCKPHGQTLESRFGMEVGQTKVLDFSGRLMTVTRLPDEDDDKSFEVIL